MHTDGTHGLRAIRLGAYDLHLLVDFGPRYHATSPRVLRCIDGADARRLLGDLMDCVDPDLKTQPPEGWTGAVNRQAPPEPRDLRAEPHD
jgi:hypothetical protein